MHENEVTRKIIEVAIEIHKTLGPGLFESVYEKCLEYELTNAGLDVKRQKSLPMRYKDLSFQEAFRIDLLVENKVIVEVKSVEKIAPVHHAQLLTYLRLTNLKCGLLINFNNFLLKDGVKRVVNNL